MDKNGNQSNKMKSKVFSGIIWTFLERTASQSVTLILSIILARLLSPDEYGVISIVMIFISVANVFITSGFGNALIQKKNADNLDFSSVFYFSFFLSLALYIILFFAAPIISFYYRMPELTMVMRVLGLYIPIIGFNAVQEALVSKYMMFKKFFISTLSGTILSAIIGIICAYLGAGVWALVAQRLSNVLINTIVLWRIVEWRPTLEYSFTRMKSIISYGWKLFVSSLIGSLSDNLRNFIIGIKFSPEALALYTQGNSYPNQIGTNINSTISKVLFPALSEFQDDLEKTRHIMRRAIKISTYIMTPMLIGLAAIANPLVKLLLTDEWLGIVEYIQIFSIYFIFIPIHTINLQVIKAIGRSDLFLKLEIIKRTYGLLILFITVFFFNSVTTIALGMVLQTLISCFVNASPNKKILKYGYIQQMRDIVPNLVVSFVMGICVYSINLLNLNLIQLLLLQVIVGAITYILISYMFRLDSFKYLSSIILSKTNKWKLAFKR
ncbi:lipopolysaccharide biosynthesis protein [Carnobacterium pleistocenium]|uniref:lipopolysaccharide biosynthesis protein n=1 Tax=Carnobacterium pleistocenium TaxID=181073 RepID=UPI0006893739|nr:lipopolysaccharide biosynthesis protein [Carnobacterium pleistocenium]